MTDCGHATALVCGEEVCGTCYGEALLTEPLPMLVQRGPIDLTKGLFGHDEHRRSQDGEVAPA
jgi:hypothetical protein